MKSMILNEKVFVKSVILKKKISSCQILNQNFFVVSDFKSAFLQRVRFQTIYLSPPHVLSHRFPP